MNATRKQRIALPFAALILLATLVAPATPARAATGAPGEVTGRCTIAAGAASGTRATYVVYGITVAVARTGEATAATTVECEVYDVISGVVYGGCSAAMPGPVATVECTVSTQLGRPVAVRWCGSGLFSSGRTTRACNP